MLSLPRSVRLAAWATMWFAGRCDLRELTDRVRGDDEPHELVDAPSLDSFIEVLPFWHKAGAHAVVAALPRAGDPHGLSGPVRLTESAVAAGEAVIAVGAPYALVPRVTPFGPPGDQGHFVGWVWHDAHPPPAGASIAQADRELNEALLAASRVLADLDVPSWRPEVARLLDDVRSGRASAPLPHGYSQEAQALAARSARLWTIAEFALADDGGAVTVRDASTRRDALIHLERAARHALVAACNDRGAGQ